jgi:hypothetical protein
MADYSPHKIHPGVKSTWSKFTEIGIEPHQPKVHVGGAFVFLSPAQPIARSLENRISSRGIRHSRERSLMFRFANGEQSMQMCPCLIFKRQASMLDLPVPIHALPAAQVYRKVRSIFLRSSLACSCSSGWRPFCTSSCNIRLILCAFSWLPNNRWLERMQSSNHCSQAYKM